jgi:hypothetical protein
VLEFFFYFVAEVPHQERKAKAAADHYREGSLLFQNIIYMA